MQVLEWGDQGSLGELRLVSQERGSWREGNVVVFYCGLCYLTESGVVLHFQRGCKFPFLVCSVLSVLYLCELTEE